MEVLEVVALVMTNKLQMVEQEIHHQLAPPKVILVAQIQHNQAHILLLEEVALLLLALMVLVRNQVLGLMALHPHLAAHPSPIAVVAVAVHLLKVRRQALAVLEAAALVKQQVLQP
jgi:hypothetical protein